MEFLYSEKHVLKCLKIYICYDSASQLTEIPPNLAMKWRLWDANNGKNGVFPMNMSPYFTLKLQYYYNC